MSFFDILYQDNQDLNDVNSSHTKAALFYKSCLDMKRRNIETIPSLKKIVNEITKDAEYEKNLAALISAGLTNRMINLYPKEIGVDKYQIAVRIILYV